MEGVFGAFSRGECLRILCLIFLFFIMEILASFSSIWLALHLFAMVLGLGGATYSDLLLLHFLKDLKISKKEADIIRTMARVILLGIFLAFLSGLLLFLPEMERLLNTPKFLVKCVVFVILTFNGFFLHHLVLPRLVKFSFHHDHYVVQNILHLRHVGFIMGAISLVSWYTVFLLGTFKNIPYGFWTLLGGYFFVLVVAITTALFVERSLGRSLK